MLERLEERIVLSAIVVTGTGDAIAADGFVTLREAITSINNGANVDADVTGVGTYGVNDSISFNIVGAGVQTISPASPLPTLLKPVVINGYSQPSAMANTLISSDNAVLLIQLDGSNAGVGANGIVLGAGSGSSTVSGLVINRFAGTGILVQSSGNTIAGNFIGTTATGNASLSQTGSFGIGIDGGSSNTIGGTTPAARNVIGGNSDGINLNTGSQSNIIQGNFIGVGADGTTAVGNRFHGVALRGNGGLGVQNNQIGGTLAGAGNKITNNGAAGVAVFGDATVNPQNSGNAILGNSIFNNGLLNPANRVGIDLVGTGIYPADDGVTVNDSVDGDGDSGPNQLQNYPVLISTSSDSVSTTIVGTLNSRADTEYRLEFFSSSSVSGTGHGEGQTFLGFTNITTNAAGNVHFNTTLMMPVTNGQFISATATSLETTSTPAPTSPAGVLGTASTFAILAGGAVSATLTDVTGDIGVFPAAAVTATGNNSGTIHNGDAVAAQAQADLTVAYNTLAALPPTMQMAGDLGGLTLTPGVYHFTAAATLTGTLTLDTQGDPDAFFVFQMDAAFAAAAASSVAFLNGATDSLYWKGAAAFGLGADAHFAGNIVGNLAITMGAGATLANGRALSRTGAVTTSGGYVDLTSTTPAAPSTPNNTSEFSASLPVPTLTVAPVVTATTFIIVTGTGDAVAFDGVVTLREAMMSINNAANINADVMAYGTYGVNDTISFNIPGTGVQTISPATPLPTLVKPVDIDGYTQPGTSANTSGTIDNAILLVQISGTSSGVGANGIVFGAGSGGSTVSGLVINNFNGAGILVQSNGNTIAGNYIGTTAAGTAGLSLTGGFGIAIDGGSTNTIGGTTPAARNVIGGNSDGINLNTGSQSNIIQGNFIGVGADGTTAVGNRFHGVALRGNGGLGVQNNQIGGTVPGAGNTIANSGSAGVAVFGNSSVDPQNSGNAILGNSIFNNGLLSPATRLGIDLVGTGTYPADDGVTQNDPIDGDGDSGPNLLQNYPILASATSDSVSTTILGTLNSRANTLYRIEFFSNSTASASGYGEGQTFFGFTDVTTDDTGNASFNTTLMTPVPDGRFITATATSLETTSTPAPTSPAGVLGTASTFAILAGGAVSATLTDVTGDIGVFPAAAVTATGNNSGTIHNGDAVAAQAQADLTVAYNTLAALPPTMQLAGDLGGLTLTPGVYHFTAAATLTGTLTLDTQGDPDAFFVFQMDAAFAAAAASSVAFLNGATDSLYWKGAAAFGLGADAHFAGNIVGNLAITMGAGATLDNGRALSRTGAVTTSGGYVDLTSTTPAAPSTPNNTSEFSAVRVNSNLTSPRPTLSISDFAMLEGNAGTSNATFTVTLSAVSGQTVTVVATSADGTANFPSDYVTLVPTTLTFLPGETSKTVTVSVNGDILSETNETLFINLTGAVNATIADGQGMNTVINDDPVPPSSPTVSVSDFAVLEGNAGTVNAVFTVTLSSVSAQAVTVVAASANGTATSPSDYLALPPTTLTFLPGQTSKTVTVTINGDVVSEANETLFVNLTGATNATIGDGQGLLTIINDDPVPPSSPTLTISDFAVLEGNSGQTNAVFTVTLSSVTAQTVTVVATSADGTATTPSDYMALLPTTLTFLPGETSKTVTVIVQGDTLSEGNETLFVNLTGATNATISDGQALLTLINDDPVPPASPTLSISDFAMLEGNAGTTNAVFTVTLSSVAAQTVTVVATSANGTSSAGSDYVALVPTTLTFLPGEFSKTVTIAVNGDLLSETDETFFVNLTGAINATIADGQGTNTIINDDPVPPSSPTLSINDFAVLEGNAGATNAVFTVTLSGVSAQTVTVIVSSANGTATTPSDYAALGPTTLTFLPGETTKTVTVAVNGDLLNEANETLFVNLTSSANATIADGQGLMTVINDDPVPPPASTLSISDITVLEGNAATTSAVFTVTLSAISSQTVTVIATSANGTASSPSDYQALLPTTLTFLPGETTKTVTVIINGDSVDESNETFSVNLTGATNASIADNEGLATITNDDSILPPSTTLSISDFAILEGNAGTTSAVFTVTLSAISAQTVTVIATSANGTATASTDYLSLVPTTLTFLPGETTQTVTVLVNGDTVNEGNETLFVNLTGATNATIADDQGLLTIINDDPLPPANPTLSISDFAVLEGNAGTTSAVFTVTLSAVSGQTVTVLATSADGTATTPSDYLAFAPTTLTFLPGETTKTVTVAVHGDTTNEANETLVVNLSGATNSTISDSQGLLTIINDDPLPPAAPTLAISDFAVLEGNSGTTTAVFTVTLSAVSAQTVTVMASSADGNATTPSDYLALLPTTLTFLPGETSKTISVEVNGDVTIEPNEAFFVNLSVPTNATVVDGQGLGTIINDDLVPPPAPTLSISDFAVLEGNSGTINAIFTVTLSAISSQTVTVVATSADGNATTTNDYLALLPTTLTFLPGETSKTVSVTVNGDVTIEPNETFFVNLTGATNASVFDAQGLGTIINDDLVPPPTPTLSISDFAVLEGNAGTTNAVFTVNLSAVSAQTVTVVAGSADGNATTPSDYLALLPTTLTFLPGETSKTVSVAVNGDVSIEPNETFFINLSLPTNATVLDGQGLGTIINDDLLPPPAPTLSINDFAVVEGNSGTTNAVFTVTLSAVSAQTVTVVATSADGTAVSPSDYFGLTPTTLTFLPGETTKTVSVLVNGDVTAEPDESLFVNLTAATNATIADNQGLLTIIDDDLVAPPTPTLSISDVSILEGNAGSTNAVFTVTLSAVSAQTVTVQANSANGAATTPSDYQALIPTTLTFLPGETSKTITVVVNGDGLFETDESFFVNLSDATNATVADGQGLGTITNDDAAITSTVTIAKVNDGAETNTPTNGKFRVTLSSASASDTVINYSINGTATPGVGQDYGTLAGTVTILAGQTTSDIDVIVLNDSIVENAETVTVTLTGLGAHDPAISLDTTPANLTATVNISDDDQSVSNAAPVFINASPTFSVPENSIVGTVVGAVAATDSDIPAQTLTYSILNGNASGAFAINPVSGEITVADATPLNFEVTTSFTLTVQVTDNSSPTPGLATAVVVVNVTNVGPLITIPNPIGTYQIGNRTPVLVASDATITDEDVASPNFSNATLTVSVIAGRSKGDQLKLVKGNSGSAIHTKGRKLFAGNVQIGTFLSGGSTRQPNLVVTFNSSATLQAVQNVLRSVNFRAKTGGGTTRTLQLQVTNIGGVSSNAAVKNIVVTSR